MIGSVLSIVSFVLYFTKKLDAIYVTILYVTFRNLIRMMDFE